MSPQYETLLVGGVPDEGEANSLHIPEKYGVHPQIIQSLERNISFQKDRKAYKEIKEIIARFQPDIVHTHASKAGALGRRAAIKMKVPVILHTFHGHVFHSYFGKTKTQFYKTVERQLAKKSTGVIAISPRQKQELTEEHRITTPDKCHVVRLGFDLSIFENDTIALRKKMRQDYLLNEDTVAIGIIGRLAPIKDHHFFLNAIQKLIQENQLQNPVKIFIIGDGVLSAEIRQQMQNIEQTLNKPNLFVMTSWVHDLTSIIHGLDIIALSSKNEGTPVSLIEGMAAKKPVVSTKVGGVEDIIENSLNGFYSNVNDMDSYINHLAQLINNQDLRFLLHDVRHWPHC